MTDIGRIVNEAGLDTATNNTRVRATTSPVTVGTITFPAAPLGINYTDGIGTPISTAPGATTTILAEQLLTGLITYSPSTGCTATFDTATNIVNGINLISSGAQVGDIVTCLIINGNGTNAITLAVPASGAFDGNNANRSIPASTSRYVWIRLTNVTPGSMAYVVYF